MLTTKASLATDKNFNKAFKIFLLPIPTKIKNPDRLYAFMIYFQSIAAEVNMKYLHCTHYSLPFTFTEGILNGNLNFLSSGN